MEILVISLEFSCRCKFAVRNVSFTFVLLLVELEQRATENDIDFINQLKTTCDVMKSVGSILFTSLSKIVSVTAVVNLDKIFQF